MLICARPQLAPSLNYDPYWSDTIFLAHMDALSEQNGIPITNAGASFSSNVLFDDKPTVLIGDSGANFGLYTTGSFANLMDGRVFTAECYFYPLALPVSNPSTLLAQWRQSTNTDGWVLRIGTDGKLYVLWGPLSTTVQEVASVDAINLNQWNHAAIIRNGTSLRVYLNGQRFDIAIPATNLTRTHSLMIGNYLNSAGIFGAADTESFNGHMAGVRVTSWVERYLDSFTPEFKRFYDMHAIPYDWDSVLFAAHLIDSTQDSKHGYTGNAVGDAIFNTVNQLFGEGSLRLDGDGDYLTYDGNVFDVNKFHFGTGDFTVEAWVKLDDATPRTYGHPVYSTWSGAPFNLGTSLQLARADAGNRFVMSNTTRDAEQTVDTDWHHWAVCKRNGQLAMFFDGFPISAPAAYSAADSSPSETMYVGTFNSAGIPAGGTNNSLVGSIRELVLSRGARYPNAGAFSPPIKKFDTYPSVNPLTKQVFAQYTFPSNTNVDDVTGSSITLSNASITNSSLVTLASGSSNATFPGRFFWESNQDFTIEMHAQVGSMGSDGCALISLWNVGGSSNNGWLLYVNSSRKAAFSYSSTGSASAASLAGTTTLASNVPFHVAVVRYKGVITLYINGNAEASVTSALPVFKSTRPMSCRWNSVQNYGSAERRRIRMTKAAVYLGNFVPPTVLLPLA